MIQIESEVVKTINSDNLIFRTKDSILIVTVNGKPVVVYAHSIISRPNISRKAQCIVIVHGANSGPVSWLDTAKQLTLGGFIVHCVSLPGFGGSSVTDSAALLSLAPSSLQQFFVDFLHEYIKVNVHSAKIHLVGHSFGGYIVSSFVSLFPDVCSSFILINSAGVLPVNGDDSWFWAILFKLGIPHYPARLFGNIINPIIHSCFALTGTYDALSHWNLAKMTCSESYGETLVSRFVYFTDYLRKSSWHCHTFSQLVTNKCPAIGFVWGSDDTIIPLHIAQLLSSFSADTIPIPIMEIPDVWHIPTSKPILLAQGIICAIRDARHLVANPLIKCTVDAALYSKHASYSFKTTADTIDKLHAALRETILEMSHNTRNESQYQK